MVSGLLGSLPQREDYADVIGHGQHINKEFDSSEQF